MQDQRPLRIVRQRHDGLHPQELLPMRRAQEIDEHIERRRCDRPIMQDTERADRRIMPGYVVVMMMVRMTVAVIIAVVMVRIWR